MYTPYVVKKIYQIIFKATHKNVRFHKKTEFGATCKFEGNNLIAYGTDLRHVFMGYGSYVGEFSCLRGVKIGKYTSIGPYVRTYIGRHPANKFVSSHPAFYSAQTSCGFSYVQNQKFEEIRYAAKEGKDLFPIKIGSDVWIGAGVTIGDGVSIGDGAIIGANSLVLDDVPPYSIALGTPAKIFRKRFEEDDINLLMNIKWWDKDEAWLIKNAILFENIENFRKEI